ncbi:MAG: Eco57I restriction-modification methylase domain-containing protein [Kiritimatiellae bacterium]|nr:Eco57I restriction-modification methylase domain-containing protein [Kiritimatiellia bacterium]
MFIDGLNAREQTFEFKKKFGRIPYLNGGMFEEHEIEKRYPELDIPDEIFETLFAFFDEWNWHLDTSITASGKDINPDVLGYIFEQYINDRAQMGAYYTKEDITEYIGRNTILPWLFNEVAKKSVEAFKPNGEVWRTLREAGDRVIFPAMLKGMNYPLPPEIEKGVDASKPDLRKRRSEWNKPALETHALPTEIWRETVARRQRCQTLQEKIVAGEITTINDFITYNLDIRKFTEILLSQTTDHLLIRHFYEALKRVTILDPTCGSGAFLFAALNILEPLYEICLTRMQEDWPEKFKRELEIVKTKYRDNLKYCIYKDIILNNLYGVDIMREATEIARLRLFLKMLAVVDVNERDANLGVDPLPDIDFNIRCGNTLVGFVNPKDVRKAILPEDELALDTEAYDRVEAKAADVSDMYERFKTLQQTADGSQDYYLAKKELKSHLAALNDELCRAMAWRHYGITSSSLSENAQFEEWRRKTQPFHWYAEFYGIVVANGGFDVIIGNPPYVEYSKVKDYKIKGYKTEPCGNLYAYVTERCLHLSKNEDRIGFIVPLTISSNNNMKIVRDLIVKSGTTHFSHYETRPSRLFEGADQRLTIFLISQSAKKVAHSTSILRWSSECRDLLFSLISYGETVCYNRLWRMASSVEKSIFEKIVRDSSVGERRLFHGEKMWYRTAGVRYWVIFNNNGFGTESLSNKFASFATHLEAQYFMAALNSNLFWWYYAINFDMFNLKDYMIFSFPLTYIGNTKMCQKAAELEADLFFNRELQIVNRTTLGRGETFVYKKKKSKPIIDEIDELLAQHYGFTEEELDFIINYDIKYRMGDELNTDE